MKTDYLKDPRAIAAAATLVVALLIVLMLRLGQLTLVSVDAEWPPRHDADVALVEDERLFDVVEDIAPTASKVDNPAPAHSEVKESHKSDPAPQSGHHTIDRGKAADAPAHTTQATESPVKVQKEDPREVGPSKEELERIQAEEARRKASAATASAFQRSEGKNNTRNNGRGEGNSDSPEGTSTSISGTGTGSVGGGWALPRYAKVPASITGTIKMMVKVGRDGRVTSVTFQGGDAPAATDPRLRSAVEAEVRSRRFTRPAGDDAPDQATAYITYRFK